MASPGRIGIVPTAPQEVDGVLGWDWCSNRCRRQQDRRHA
jgi:hypothetical protein